MICGICNFNMQSNYISYGFEKQNGIAWSKYCSFIRRRHNISLRQQRPIPFSRAQMFLTARVRELFCRTP